MCLQRQQMYTRLMFSFSLCSYVCSRLYLFSSWLFFPDLLNFCPTAASAQHTHLQKHINNLPWVPHNPFARKHGEENCKWSETSFNAPHK